MTTLPDMAMGGRATGKTFRSLLRCLAAASEGKTIIYLTLHTGLPQWYCTKAALIARSYLPDDAITRDNTTLKIKGAGKIHFLHVDNIQRRGLSGEEVCDD